MTLFKARWLLLAREISNAKIAGKPIVQKFRNRQREREFGARKNILCTLDFKHFSWYKIREMNSKNTHESLESTYLISFIRTTKPRIYICLKVRNLPPLMYTFFYEFSLLDYSMSIYEYFRNLKYKCKWTVLHKYFETTQSKVELLWNAFFHNSFSSGSTSRKVTNFFPGRRTLFHSSRALRCKHSVKGFCKNSL